MSQPVDLTGEYMCKKKSVQWNLWLIYIAGDGLGYGCGLRFGFLSYIEIGSRDPSPSLCTVNMLCIVQYSHRVWNPSLSVYRSPSPAMWRLLLSKKLWLIKLLSMRSGIPVEYRFSSCLCGVEYCLGLFVFVLCALYWGRMAVMSWMFCFIYMKRYLWNKSV